MALQDGLVLLVSFKFFLLFWQGRAALSDGLLVRDVSLLLFICLFIFMSLAGARAALSDGLVRLVRQRSCSCRHDAITRYGDFFKKKSF